MVFYANKNFFKIIFEFALDFLVLSAHTKRALKLRQTKKRNLNPWNLAISRRKEIIWRNRNIVNKSSSSKDFWCKIQESVQEEICRQLNLELSKLWLSQCAYPRQVVGFTYETSLKTCLANYIYVKTNWYYVSVVCMHRT